MDVILDDTSFIPIAYDYMCEVGACRGQYQSFKSS